jgi:Tfp pilus assembly protein PilF
MNNKQLKYLFFSLAALLLLLMLKGGKDAGISGDEYLHYNQSVSVYNYFATLGKDSSALNTPNTHLKYYGQSVDNLTTIAIKWFNIDDLFLFRHLSNSIIGWLTILIASLFAISLSGYGAGILVVMLFSLSPTFLGHAQNNLKDIPFALGYIMAIYFTIRLFLNDGKNKIYDPILLTTAIAFSISIRSGGLILICYLFFFFILHILLRYQKEQKIDLKEVRNTLLRLLLITAIALCMSILLWPYGQQNPLSNIWTSYKVMSQFPTTIRQLFEGKTEWSDLMPWYYLPKYMIITIPLVVFAGITAFLILAKKIISNHDTLLKYGFLIFSILFPMIFVIYEKSNLYGSWRHFLFIYPSIVILSAIGLFYLFTSFKNKILTYLFITVTIAVSIHPLRFMILNHPYYYLYYNQLVGGLNGAYGNYETDYYYNSIREGSDWLEDYLKSTKKEGPIKVASNFSANWYFRNHKEVQLIYCPYDQRSQYDWDYIVVANSYIPAVELQNKNWPPKSAIHLLYADNIPIAAICKRETKLDLQGYQELKMGNFDASARFFSDALKINDQDELIFYNFATVLVNQGKIDSAQTLLKSGLKINPGYEPALMYLGNIAVSQNNRHEAIGYFKTILDYNKKYFEAYVGLSKLLLESDVKQARALLKSCLMIDPKYTPAIRTLADSYRKSDPEVAKKYDELANSYK